MEKLFAKVLNEKLKNGEVEKIISKKIDDLVNSTLNDMFAYRGTLRKTLEEKLTSIMSDVIEKTDFNDYVDKITYVINNAVKDSKLESFKNITNTLKTMLGSNEYKINQKIKISDVFEKYEKLILEEIESRDYEDFIYDNDAEVEEGYISLNFEFKMEVVEESNFSKKIIFKTYFDDVELKEYTTEIKRYESSGSIRLIDIDSNTKTIINANSFEIEIMKMYNNFVIIEIDVVEYYDETSVDWEYEY